jgi:hypothetical protein
MAWWGHRPFELQIFFYRIALIGKAKAVERGRIQCTGGLLTNPTFPQILLTSTFDCECSLIKMAAISPATQDRLFIFGLGLATFAVLGAMRQMLVHYRNNAAIPPSENKPQYITQDVEDSLKLSTLDKLLDSPNYCIQETTAIIICERALHDGTTIDVLLWYITRPDHKLREKGIRALTMMMNSCEYILPIASYVTN